MSSTTIVYVLPLAYTYTTHARFEMIDIFTRGSIVSGARQDIQCFGHALNSTNGFPLQLMAAITTATSSMTTLHQHQCNNGKGDLAPLGNDVITHVIDSLTPLELITFARTDRYLYYMIIHDGWKGEDRYWQRYLISTSLPTQMHEQKQQLPSSSSSSSSSSSHDHATPNDDAIIHSRQYQLQYGRQLYGSRDMRRYHHRAIEQIFHDEQMAACSSPSLLPFTSPFLAPASSVPTATAPTPPPMPPLTLGATAQAANDDQRETKTTDDASSDDSNSSDDDDGDGNHPTDQSDSKHSEAPVSSTSPRPRKRIINNATNNSDTKSGAKSTSVQSTKPLHVLTRGNSDMRQQQSMPADRYWFNNIRRLLYGHMYLREQIDHHWTTYHSRQHTAHSLRRLFSFTQRGIMPVATWLGAIYFLAANSAFSWSATPTRMSHIATCWLTLILLIWCIPVVYIAMLLRLHDDWSKHLDHKYHARRSLKYVPFRCDRRDSVMGLTTAEKRAQILYMDERRQNDPGRIRWPLPYWVWDYGQIWLWPPLSTATRTRSQVLICAGVFASLLVMNSLRLMFLYGVLPSITPVMTAIGAHMCLLVCSGIPEIPFFLRGRQQRRFTIWLVWLAQLLISAWPYDWSPYVMHTSSFTLLVAMCVTIAETEAGGVAAHISRGIDTAIITWIICAVLHHLLVTWFDIRWMMFIAWLPLTAIACVVFFETSRNAVARRPLR